MADDSDAVSRAELARQVIENPIFVQAMDDIKGALLEKWLATRDTDIEERERAWKHRKFVDVFEGVLRGYIERGKAARSEIDRP